MIIDSHVHLITARMIRDAAKRYDKIRPGLLDRVVHGGKKLVNPEFIKFLNDTSIPGFARMWEKELDANGVDHAIFLPISGSSLEQLDQFVALNSARFSAYVLPENPVAKNAAGQFARHVRTGRFRGIKLYPPIQLMSVADERLFPIYEKAGELGAPVLIHFGVTHAPVTDYRFANPLDLQLPSKIFPDTNFIIAHFGAGFFREVLMLGYHAENIYVDTSGTNNWREYLPQVMPLKKVFERTLKVYGPERVLFGTDTSLNNKTGYRRFVLREQRKALSDLKVSAKTKALVMGGNTARLFGLADKVN